MTEYKIEEAFDPEMLLGNLVMVEFFGEGYYSGNTESHVAFFESDDFEQIESVFEDYTPYFHELDGKHSEVQGVVNITKISTLEELKQCIGTYECSDDYYPIFDTCIDESEFSDMSDMLHQTHDDIVSKFEVKTTTEYFVQGTKI